MESVYVFLRNTALTRMLDAALSEAGYQAAAVELLLDGILSVTPLDDEEWDYQVRVVFEATEGRYIVTGKLEN